MMSKLNQLASFPSSSSLGSVPSQSSFNSVMTVTSNAIPPRLGKTNSHPGVSVGLPPLTVRARDVASVCSFLLLSHQDNLTYIGTDLSHAFYISHMRATPLKQKSG